MPLGTTFNEICKLSMINATKALSKFLGEPIGLDFQPVEIGNINELNRLMSPSQITINLSLPIKGNLKGAAFFLYSQKEALAICDVLLKRKSGETKVIGDLEVSVLTELANVVLGNFLTSFAQLLHVDVLVHHHATFENGPFDIIYEQICTMIEASIKQSVVQIGFDFQHFKLHGVVLIVLDKEVVQQVLQNLENVLG